MDTKRFTNTSVLPNLSQLFARQTQAWPILPQKASVGSASWRVSLLPKASWPRGGLAPSLGAKQMPRPPPCSADSFERGEAGVLAGLENSPGASENGQHSQCAAVALSMLHKLIWFVVTFYSEIMPNLQRGFKNFILKTSQIPLTKFTNCSRFVSLLNISFLFLI